MGERAAAPPAYCSVNYAVHSRTPPCKGELLFQGVVPGGRQTPSAGEDRFFRQQSSTVLGKFLPSTVLSRGRDISSVNSPQPP